MLIIFEYDVHTIFILVIKEAASMKHVILNKSVLNYKKTIFWITILTIIVCIIAAFCFLTNPKKDLDDAMAEEDNSLSGGKG